MSRTRIKICGITRPEDARSAADCGVDAIGLVFYEPSPRSVTIAQAREICRALPPLVSPVGLFVNPAPELVRHVLAEIPLAWLQFHGDEDAEFCEQFGRPYLKAVRVQDPETVSRGFERFPGAAGLLVDAYDPGRFGGTGQTFNWTWLPTPGERPVPMMLAGGLTPANVADAVRMVRPWAVDVSGGVESSRGIKDPGKIRQFVDGVRSVHEND